jgi:hypothetical protein
MLVKKINITHHVTQFHAAFKAEIRLIPVWHVFNPYEAKMKL